MARSGTSGSRPGPVPPRRIAGATAGPVDSVAEVTLPTPTAPSEETEERRLAALRGGGILDSGPEPAFDDVARAAAAGCKAPLAAVSLVDEGRVWFKARLGLAAAEVPRQGSFCAEAILGGEVLVVPDAGADGRFVGHPLVAGEPHVRFYAGTPLLADGGLALGTVCVMDLRSRELAPAQAEMLRRLGRHAAAILDLRAGATSSWLRPGGPPLPGPPVEETLRTIFERSPLGIAMIGADLRLLRLNPALCDLLGCEEGELFGGPARDALHPEDGPRADGVLRSVLEKGKLPHALDTRLRRRDGREVWARLTVTRVPGPGGAPACLVMAEDVTVRRWLASEYRSLALTDSLTGLPNRRAGREALARESARSHRFGLALSLALIDVDDFKSLNDRLGHAAGDAALVTIARALSSLMRASDHLVRWGGDEFLAVLAGVPLAGAGVFAERARSAVARLAPPAEGSGPPTVSIGLAELLRDEEPWDALARADENVYRAKAEGRNRMWPSPSADPGRA